MDFYHGLAMCQAGVDISLSGLLSIDGTISSGMVYEDDIKRLYPFPNTMIVLKMSGEEIQKYLEASYDSWICTVSGPGEEVLQTKVMDKADGSQKWNFKNSPANFDSAAGFDYTVDVTKPAGERVSISAMADGSDFKKDANYNVAINSYRASGAGKLLQAAGIDPKNMDDRIVLKDKPFRDILKEYMDANNGEINPARMKCGNWSFVPQPMVAESMKSTLARIFGTPDFAPYYDTKAEIDSDIERTGAVYYMYPTDTDRPTKAPKGYKPFYISHLGRHGARHALGNTIYTDMMDMLEKAHINGWLTQYGEDVYKSYKDFYPQVANREGILTRKGQLQHRQIARRMYRVYPAVFKGETHAEAVSTISHRVIASMYNFLGELDSLDKSFSANTDYGQPYQALLDPKVDKQKAAMPKSVEKKARRFSEDRFDSDAVLRRICNEPDSLGSDKYKVCSSIHEVISDLDNLDIPAPEILYTIFTPEERYRIWEVYNFNGYLRYGRSPDVNNLRVEAMQPLLNEIISSAESDWEQGTDLRLRFAHDITLLPLATLMDLNGMGVSTTDPYELENYWRTYDIPMACNLQLVFFKKSKGDDILVQVLFNEKEATLPLEMAADGCFYRWKDIKARYKTEN